MDEITDTDVVCTARTAAALDGLLTVFHTERASEGVSNVQNDLEVRATMPRRCQKVLECQGGKTPAVFRCCAS